MQTSFVYILECADHTFYVGVTANIEQRLAEHQQGKYDGSYTSRRLPVELVFYCQFMDINLAIEFEKKIKKWSHAKKQALIEGRFEDLTNLARKNFKK
ncbi:GIY-YIG nuclease family protein [Kaistella polysaccharea]|uniref:GIY-YIG nuclease family protein n=1 Tax=Kaistella polysaccharea TaxID=2878534 RepID=UPI001CF54F08|nr:GIY-YIG nuclease family protein [Kaistella polysaccharea]